MQIAQVFVERERGGLKGGTNTLIIKERNACYHLNLEITN